MIISGEVGGHAVFKLLGLSDVDYIAVRVFHYIDAGGLGQGICLIAQSFKSIHTFTPNQKR